MDPDRSGASGSELLRDDRRRARVALFFALSVALHLVAGLAPWPESTARAAGADEATFVEVVEVSAPRPEPVARHEAARPQPPRPAARPTVRAVGARPRPGPVEGAAPAAAAAPRPAPPAPAPAGPARDELSPARAALRLLATTEPAVMPQGRVDEMFRCGRRSNGEVSCGGYSPLDQGGASGAAEHGSGWDEPGRDNGGWGQPGCRTCALQTAPDPYCE